VSKLKSAIGLLAVLGTAVAAVSLHSQSLKAKSAPERSQGERILQRLSPKL
jgi:hypothetical protein